VTVATPAAAQAPPPADGTGTPVDPAELVNALLAGLMGQGEVTAAQLQQEVAEVGGIPFRQDVPVAFLGREALSAYLRDVFDSEYPVEQARADERLLHAFDLLPAGTDLRAIRARVLEENVVGFYDERPDHRRLYAVSGDRTFTPMNQIVLAHELRHALQDQYQDLHAKLTDGVGDFDDRRVAWMALLEGDATLVMERFLRRRLGGLGGIGAGAEEAAAGEAGDAAAETLAIPGMADLPGAPPVVRDQLVQPYLTGLGLARALWQRGGADAIREAWARPPESTEQVLHPAKFFAREPPRVVVPRLAAPASGRPLSEGVLGELLLRTFLGEGQESAAEGWGGDGWRLWDVGGRTALAWRSEWDTTSAASEFDARVRERFARRHGPGTPRGSWLVFGGEGGWQFALRRDGDAIELASADAGALLAALLDGTPNRSGGSLGEGGPLDSPGGEDATVPLTAMDATDASGARPAEGGKMASTTPSGGQSDLGMAPNVGGLLCYVPCCIGLVFSVVAVIVEKRNRFVRFHAFQSLLLHAAAIVLGLGLFVVHTGLAFSGLGMVGLLISLLQMVVGVALLGLTIFMMIKANANEEFELPVIGPMARQWV
jgi:uncharacterized membrane protein